MTIKEINAFTKFPLSETEERAGAILTSLNLAAIQNMRADIAQSKINLPFTPNDPLSYAQEEAYLRGQLDILLHLIDRSNESQPFHHIESPSQE